MIRKIINWKPLPEEVWSIVHDGVVVVFKVPGRLPVTHGLEVVQLAWILL